ncbi:mannose-1-phosphate guanylyltransferase [Anaerophilus nitritogenes]|uniref:mannose-1-phosphate guanylyltransferase n=1 Tax=Anaerophilus nitritogenes TaxID=2498136 RepID=UPI00101E1A3C|nr:mannose-1-phosphate guanylyltransferase [Anaerophilus nitritogenes]
MITAVIMAGGKGERFWPRSRKSLPKQLISLTGEKTMIQETVDRLKGFIEEENIYIATGEEYEEIIKQQLPQVPKENIIVEPMGKNTAACIGLAAKYIERKNPNATMIVLPSDHLIKNVGHFKNTLLWAARVAENDDNLVTLGITPTHPETGYGYINFESNTELPYCSNAYKVKGFVEKPDKHTAMKYLESGEYLWNSGMFIWKVSTILNNIQKHMPKLDQVLNEISHNFDTQFFEKILYDEYSKLESISIDYGIMEKADNIYVLPCIFGWDDVGSWTALERINEKDDYGNIIKGNIVHLDTKQCIIEGNEKLIATIGIEDLIIVDTEDAMLICSKEKAQEVKVLLKELKERKAEKYL